VLPARRLESRHEKNAFSPSGGHVLPTRRLGPPHEKNASSPRRDPFLPAISPRLLAASADAERVSTPIGIKGVRVVGQVNAVGNSWWAAVDEAQVFGS
jgi:hypothetical protein